MDQDIFFEVHDGLPCEGSGRTTYTQRAYQMISPKRNPRILDIGCGPGAATLELAKLSNGTVIGLDIHQPYLDVLEAKAKKFHLSDRVITVNQSMVSLQFPKKSFDVIWAEGSIYILGFEQGLREWKKYIKPAGFLVVHEMAWLKPDPPIEIKDYWKRTYPGITTIDENIGVISRCGYHLLGFFPLPEDFWWKGYYGPLEERLAFLRKKYKDDPASLEVIEEEQKEIDLYRQYSEWYGSVFFIMQKDHNTKDKA